MECAPEAGLLGPGEFDLVAGLLEDESHGQTPFP